jgi:hypothetical protein
MATFPHLSFRRFVREQAAKARAADESSPWIGSVPPVTASVQVRSPQHHGHRPSSHHHLLTRRQIEAVMASKPQSKSANTTSAKTTPAKTPGAQDTQGQSPQGQSPQGQSAPTDAVSLLKQDHRRVEQLFQKYEAAGSNTEKQDLVRQICTELIVHTQLEEEIFYPACREKTGEGEQDALDEAQIEHDSAKILIGEIMSQNPGAEFYDAKVSVLSEYIKHHVGEEEKPSDGIFAKAKTAAVDMNALGQSLQARRQELLSKAGNKGFRPPQPRALELSRFDTANIQEYQAMDRRFDRDRDEQGRFTSEDDRDNRSRYGSRSGGRDDDTRRGSRSDDRNRDEYGRFTSDDDRGGYSRGRSSGSNDRERDEYGRFSGDDDRGGYRGRSSGSSDRDRDEYGRFTSDDDRGGYSRGRSSGSNDRDRDEYGRFTSDDDREGRSGRGSGRDYNEDWSRGRGEGGGSYSDSRSGSMASQRGWENRGNWRGSSRDDDEDDRSSRTGRSQGSGWHGDPEGHREAARRGWEERDDSRSSRGRGSDNDDDRRGSSRGSGGQGGWFGDSRGHAEAARRGWRNRD